MTHRRERDIRRMVADLGMEVTSFRQDGGSHWRVDVKTPNGRQRPFTFPTRSSGNWHSERNEIAMLRRWRREVMPELDAAEEAGELPVPDSMKGALATRLEQLHIPLKTEPEAKPGKRVLSIPPSHVSDVVLAATAVAHADKDMQRAVIHLAPRHEREEFKPGTPEHALASVVADKPKESNVDSISVHVPDPKRSAGGLAKKGIKNNFLGRAGEIRLADWLRQPGRLDGPTNSILLAEQASKELEMTITHSNVLGLLKDLGLEIKKISRAVPIGGKHVTRHEYMAQVLLCVVERLGGTVPDQLLALATGDREVRFANAPMPTWPGQG